MCSLNDSKCSSNICNNHGKCLKSISQAKRDDKICECSSLYSGRFCDRCLDSSLIYPDCLKASKYSRGEISVISNRDFSSEVDADDHGCQLMDYPTDLDRIEFLKGIPSGLHLSEVYHFNHKLPNIIEFTARSEA